MYTLLLLFSLSLTFVPYSDEGPGICPHGGRARVHSDGGPCVNPNGGPCLGTLSGGGMDPNGDRGAGLDPNG